MRSNHYQQGNPISFTRKKIDCHLLNQYMKRPKKQKFKNQRNPKNYRNSRKTHFDPHLQDLRYGNTITSNELKSNNQAHQKSPSNFPHQKNNNNQIPTQLQNPHRADPYYAEKTFEHPNETFPEQSNHYSHDNKLHENVTWMQSDSNTGNPIIEIKSNPEIFLNLNPNPPNQIYQFEDKYVKNVSSLKNSSLLLGRNSPEVSQTQTNFKVPNYEAKQRYTAGRDTPQFTNEYLSATMPGIFHSGSQNNDRSHNSRAHSNGLKKSSQHSSVPQRRNHRDVQSVERSYTTNSRDPSQNRARNLKSTSRNHPNSDYISLPRQNSQHVLRELSKGSTSLPKSVRFMDSSEYARHKRRQKPTHIKSILKTMSPQGIRRISFNPKTVPNRHLSVETFSNSPKHRRALRRGNDRNSADVRRRRTRGGRNILDQNISRISEKNESFKMGESRVSAHKRGLPYPALSNTPDIVKGRVYTGSLPRNSYQSKNSNKKMRTIVLTDSRLSNGSRTVSGNALIANSVNRIRTVRESAKRFMKPLNAKSGHRLIQKVFSGLENSAKSLNDSAVSNNLSHFATSSNTKIKINPFKETIVAHPLRVTTQKVHVRNNRLKDLLSAEGKIKNGANENMVSSGMKLRTSNEKKNILSSRFNSRKDFKRGRSFKSYVNPGKLDHRRVLASKGPSW